MVKKAVYTNMFMYPLQHIYRPSYTIAYVTP